MIMTNNIQIFNNPSIDLLQVCEVDFKNVPCRGWVYVLEYGNGVVKIGCTRKLAQRYQNLVHSGADYGNVQFGRMALSPACVNYRNMESHLHRHFAVYRKQGTELFNVSLEDVVTQISKIECDFDFDGQNQRKREEFEKMKSSIISFWESEKDREDKKKYEAAKEFLSKMPPVFHLDNDDFGEIRIGAEVNEEESYVSLAMNHFENPQEWGGQPLTPDTAIALSSLLLSYAMIAKHGIESK